MNEWKRTIYECMNVSLKSVGSQAVLTGVPGSSLHQHVQELPGPG